MPAGPNGEIDDGCLSSAAGQARGRVCVDSPSIAVRRVFFCSFPVLDRICSLSASRIPTGILGNPGRTPPRWEANNDCRAPISWLGRRLQWGTAASLGGTRGCGCWLPLLACCCCLVLRSASASPRQVCLLPTSRFRWLLWTSRRPSPTSTAPCKSGGAGKWTRAMSTACGCPGCRQCCTAVQR